MRIIGKEPASERQREVIATIRAGARKGISIGFRPLESDRVRLLDDQTGHTFRRVELLEVSSVSLPACPTCLIERKQLRSRTPCLCAPGGVLAHLAADDVALVLDEEDEASITRAEARLLLKAEIVEALTRPEVQQRLRAVERGVRAARGRVG